MEEEEIILKIKEILNTKFPWHSVSDINKDTNFFNDIGIDSLDMVELVMELEIEYNKNISDDEAENVSTVGELAKVLKKYV